MSTQKIDFNSSNNQTIKSKFVDQHVYSCATSLVEYVIKKGWEDNEAPFNYDDIENSSSPKENQYKYIIDNDSEGSFSAHVEDTEGQTIWSTDAAVIDDMTDTEEVLKYLQKKGTLASYDTLIAEDDDFEEEPQEIFEWWIVSEFLYRKLKELGHPVIDADVYLWGRCTTGQAILLDYAISKICADMEILEGQANAWSAK